MFKEFVNSKCYQARRNVWANNPDIVGTKVRAKLQKNVRKRRDPDNDKRKEEPQKNNDSWNQDDSGQYSGPDGENADTGGKYQTKPRQETPKIPHQKMASTSSKSSSLDSKKGSKNNSRNGERIQWNCSPRKLQAMRGKSKLDRSRTSFRRKILSPVKKSPRDQHKRHFSRNDRKNRKAESSGRSNNKHQGHKTYEDDSAEEDSDSGISRTPPANKRPHQQSTSTPKVGNKRPKFTDYVSWFPLP